MTYEKAKEIQNQICDQFFFKRTNKEVFAGDFDNEPEPVELVYEIFNEIFAVDIIELKEGYFAIELMSTNQNLYLTPIIEFFGLTKEEISSIQSEPIILESRIRPLEIGSSIGPRIEDWRGTLGCFVKDIDNKENYILSNHHVLFSGAGHNDNFILQPSIYDGGTGKDAIGLYIRSLAPDPSGVNDFDAAVAGPISAEIQYNIPGLADTIQGVKVAAKGMKVYKIGATTNKTYGIIISVNSAIKVKDDSGRILDYQSQIRVQGTQADFLTPANFSLPGDSGSALIEYGTNMLVGLHFSGTGTIYSFSNKIDELFNKLRISL